MPLTSNEVINEQITQLLKRTNGVWRYLTKPHSCKPLKGGWKGPTHYLIWNPLKVHCGLEGYNVITWVMRSIIRIQRRHLKLERQGMTIDGSYERGIGSMTWPSLFDPSHFPNVAPYARLCPLNDPHAQHFLIL